jgi:chromosome segregation ATPase
MATQTRTTTAKGSRVSRGARSPARAKNTQSHANAVNSGVKKTSATPAGKSLDHAQRALDQAAKTEKQLRASLKQHDKAVSAAKDDLDRRGRDIKAMKSQLKTAKKSRKHAAEKLSHTRTATAATR